MPDQPMSPFELRLADAFGRYVADAPTSVDAVAMATAAVEAGSLARGLRPGRLGGRLTALRLLLVGAATLALIAGAALLAGRAPVVPVDSTPTPMLTEAAPSLGVATGPWAAIYLRTDSAAGVVDVVAALPDGTERLVRRIGTTLVGSEFPLGGYGSVSEHGWLALGTTSVGRLPLAAYGLFDLNDPTRDPLTVPFPPVIGGRWSREDLFALSSSRTRSGTGWMEIRIVDPRTGRMTELGPISLFGGGPSIVWASDGSGILDGRRIRPASGAPAVPIRPNQLFADRRVGMGGKMVWLCPQADPGADCPDGVRVRVADLGGGNAVDWYTTDAPAFEFGDAVFAADGRTLLVTFVRTSADRREVGVARLTAPNDLVELAAVEIAADGWHPYFEAIYPDDSAVVLKYWTGPEQGPVDFLDAGVLHLDGTAMVRPAGNLAGFVPARGVESWPGVGEPVAPVASPGP